MPHMISKIQRIADAYYVPIITETTGLIAIGTGVGCLGISGILKIQEYYTGRKAITPIPSDAAQFYEVGKAGLIYGFKRVAPTTGILLATYVLFSKYLTQ